MINHTCAVCGEHTTHDPDCVYSRGERFIRRGMAQQPIQSPR